MYKQIIVYNIIMVKHDSSSSSDSDSDSDSHQDPSMKDSHDIIIKKLDELKHALKI